MGGDKELFQKVIPGGGPAMYALGKARCGVAGPETRKSPKET